MSFYRSASDSDLLGLMVSGDEKAYTEIYTRYHDMLYSYALNKLSDFDEAQDVVHDVLVKIWTKRNDLAGVKSIKAYLFTAVRNKSFDIFAQKKVSEQYLSSLNFFITNYSDNTDYLVREKDLDVYIKTQVNALAPKMRQVFKLSRYNYMSNSEIASVLGISKNTVETQIKRALKTLKIKMSSFYLLLFLLLNN